MKLLCDLRSHFPTGLLLFYNSFYLKTGIVCCNIIFHWVIWYIYVRYFFQVFNCALCLYVSICASCHLERKHWSMPFYERIYGCLLCWFLNVFQIRMTFQIKCDFIYIQTKFNIIFENIRIYHLLYILYETYNIPNIVPLPASCNPFYILAPLDHICKLI